ncbi:MAG: glycosyltransferase [Gammaproteobacteria bacterium]|nr:glycosyltransferase [Gammaproteobacteria bacterium]
MLIGSGAIADRFSEFELQTKYLLYVGDINHSSICDSKVIRAEEVSLVKALQTHPKCRFIYFSSCSIVDEEAQKTEYVQHKIRMEEFIRASAENFLIVRLPQLLAISDTKSSLVNTLVDAIINERRFDLWKNAQRNLIDIDDVHAVVTLILTKNLLKNSTVDVASTCQTTVLQLVQEIERFFGTTAQYTLVDRDSIQAPNVTSIQPILDELCINFSDTYIQTGLRKYFSYLKNGPSLISIIVPTYNEEHGIEEFYRRTKNVLRKLSPRFEHEIIFVNDCSRDGTLSKLKLLSKSDHAVKVIDFSRNFGNQIGITAGIDACRGDIAIVIDDDLQDPPEIILNFIANWDKGYKVVYGVRPERQGVNPFFKVAAKLYYRVIGWLSETTIPNDTGDFRLIDRIVVETLKKIREENRYYRGLVAWVGFRQIGVIYERDKRYSGVSAFSLKKYINFAITGLTSFTERPLYFSSLFGLVITSISFVLALVLVIGKIIDPAVSVRGWTSLIVVFLFFGGIQLLSTGILGIYISKIYREIKGRPLYIVQETINIERSGHE